MIKSIQRLEELYELLISGNYLYDETVSYLDFIKILKLIKKSNRLSGCFKKSHLGMESFFWGIYLFRNISRVRFYGRSHGGYQ
ncbi:MAG: hypothetical protein ACFE8N_09155, partial [Promethearchaeota archaeon]